MMWIIFFSVVVNVCYGYNILVVFPEPTRSHGILGDAYVRTLLEAHHKVTYITPFPWADTPGNLTQIDISSNLNISKAVFTELEKDYKEQAMFLQMLSFRFGEMVLKNDNVKLFLNTKQKFDVIIAEWIDSELYSGFAAYFNCSLIWSISTHLHWQPMRLMDEVPNPAYSADVNSGSVPPLTLIQRWHELWIQMRKSWIIDFKIKPLERKLYTEVFEEAAKQSKLQLVEFEKVPDFYAMMLANTHPSVATPWRVPPTVKEIAGYHIKMPPDSLDSGLEFRMNASIDGVIYFSFGTTVSGGSMSKDVINGLLKFFGQMKQTIIWKMDQRLENVPDNVILMDWTPQTGILAHKNTMLFISHGGLLSVIEAIHFGVPVIAAPHHADQFTNVAALVKKEVAIRINNDEYFLENLQTALMQMFYDPRYRKNMEELSRIYHDRPVTPGKELVHWVEYVVRARGAAHMRSPALMVPWYQKMYLELAGVITAILIVLITIISVSCCYIRRTCY